MRIWILIGIALLVLFILWRLNIRASGTLTSGTSITIDGSSDTITATGGLLHVANNLQVDGTVTTTGRTRRVFIQPEAVRYTDSFGSAHENSAFLGYGTTRLIPWDFGGANNERYSYFTFNLRLPPDLKGTTVKYGLLLIPETDDAIRIADWSRVYAVGEPVDDGFNLRANMESNSFNTFSDRIIQHQVTATSALIGPNEIFSGRFEIRQALDGNAFHLVGCYVEYTAE